MNFKSRKLSTKLIIPITASFIVGCFTLLLAVWYFQTENKKFFKQKEVTSFETLIDNNIERISQKGLYVASIMASMDTVISLYKSYHNGADFDSITACMKGPIDDAIKNVKDNLGIIPRIHFHVSPTRSFYRCWTDKRGDDLSSFRHGVTSVIQTGKPLQGIEIGRGGFVVRGISPIINNGEILGSVECYFSIKEVMRNTKISEKEEVAIFMDTKLLDIATGFKNSSNIEIQNQVIGNFILFDKTSDNFNVKDFGIDTLNTALNKKISFEKENFLYVLTPLKNYLGKSQGVGVVQIDISETNKTFSQLTKAILIISVLLLIILSTAISFVIKKIVTKRIEKVNQSMEKMADGLLTKEISMSSVDELGNMVKSLNKLITRNKETAVFAQNIGTGNFNTEFKSLSEDDLIGNALLEMRDSLIAAKNEDEKRREEDKKQQWFTNGIATFSEILREFDDDLEKFSFKIISKLVKYLDANQGGLFIVGEDESEELHVELKATIAYDRRKFMQKRINVGEGMVGTCLYEKQSMYLIDVPENYVEITSGLGEAKPRAIFIAPLKVNDEIYGIIEIASLKEIEDYKREFVEKVGESIASAISTARINQQTKKLLEASQIQERQLAEQEEEMRQNIEEMQATQEELQRKQEKMMQIAAEVITEEQKLREFIEKFKQINI